MKRFGHDKRVTFTFKNAAKASLFVEWLTRNTNDRDYGYPFFVEVLSTLPRFTVEYGYDKKNPFARGVATGIDLA